MKKLFCLFMLLTSLTFSLNKEEITAIDKQSNFIYETTYKGYLRGCVDIQRDSIYTNVMDMGVVERTKSDNFKYNTFVTCIYEYKNGLKMVALVDDKGMVFLAMGFNSNNELNTILEIKAPLPLLIFYIGLSNGGLVATH